MEWTPVLLGRAYALRMARHELDVAQHVREVRCYGWRAITAECIANASQIRRELDAMSREG